MISIGAPRSGGAMRTDRGVFGSSSVNESNKTLCVLRGLLSDVKDEDIEDVVEVISGQSKIDGNTASLYWCFLAGIYSLVGI